MWNLDWSMQRSFLNCPTIFLERHNKAKLMSASFLAFTTFNKEILFSYKVLLF